MSVVVAGQSVGALGFVGLGVMGEPMCANLVTKSGLTVYGTDPRNEPLRALAALGMTPLGNAAEVGARADLVFICVADGEQLQKVCFGEHGLLAEGSRVKVIVDCSTTSVALTRECAAQVAAQGVTWIDAPVARMREAARAGRLSIMVGAAPDVFESLAPLLRCVGSDLVRCGPTGSGQVVKILNNKVLFEAVHSLAKGSADSKALRFQGIGHLLPGDFPSRTFPTLYARKDIGLALSLAAETGVDARCARATAGLFDKTIAAGHGADYYPVILKLIEAVHPIAQ